MKLRLLLGALVTVLVAVVAPSAAQAASVSVSFNSELVEGVPALVTVTFTGNQAGADHKASVYVIPSGGAGCAPTASTANGPQIAFVDTEDANAHGSNTQPYTPDAAGDFIACAYTSLYFDSDHPEATSATPFHVRVARATLTISQASVQAGATVSLTAAFQSEADRRLYVDYRPAGAPCASTFLLDRQTGTVALSYHEITGSGSYPFTLTAPSTAGSYVVCGYIQSTDDDTTPDATTTSTFSVTPSACDVAIATLSSRQQVAQQANAAKAAALTKKRTAQARTSASKRSYLRAKYARRHRRASRIRRTRAVYLSRLATYRRTLRVYENASRAAKRANAAVAAADSAKGAAC